jgi:hypothetical protein
MIRLQINPVFNSLLQASDLGSYSRIMQTSSGIVIEEDSLFDQIMATGATYCITPCHNCHAQVHDIGEHFGGKYETLHLWTVICLALGILGPNEREYLGEDLKEVLVFHPESSNF